MITLVTLFYMAPLQSALTDEARAGSSIRQSHRINTQQPSQTRGSPN